MASKKQKSEENGSNGNGRAHRPPPGYRKQSIDVVGYWKPEDGPIHFVPRMVKMFDSNLDEGKPSILVIGQLIDDMTLNAKSEETGKTEPVQAKSGDSCGVYYKPGMRALVNLCDAKVWIDLVGKRDVGKASPMNVYEVMSPGPNRPFTMIFDEREESAGRRTDFSGPRQRRSNVAPGRRSGSGPQGFTYDTDGSDASDEDIPF